MSVSVNNTVITSQNTNVLPNMYVKGITLPLRNGGDPLAENYHTWDTDPGHLDYSEYIILRTEFVSRTPNGWSEQAQGTTDIVDPL